MGAKKGNHPSDSIGIKSRLGNLNGKNHKHNNDGSVSAKISGVKKPENSIKDRLGSVNKKKNKSKESISNSDYENFKIVKGPKNPSKVKFEEPEKISKTPVDDHKISDEDQAKK